MNQENINNNASSDSDEISLKELILKIQEWWKYLLSKWLIILFFGLLGGALGFAYALFKKPVYIATTTFVLEGGEGGGGLGQYAGLASMAGIDLGGGGGGLFQGDNIIELYKSRTMIEKTLLSRVENTGKEQLLIDRYIEFNKLRLEWEKINKSRDIEFKSDSEGRNLSPSRLKDSLIGIVVADINKNYLTVGKPDKKLSIIKVDVKAKDELFAKSFNDQMVKNVNDFYIQTKTKRSLQNVTILQQKTDSVRRVMNGAIYSAAAVVDATPNLNPTRQLQRTAPVQKSQFSAEANKVILGELVKNLEMSKMALRKEMPLIQVVDQPIYPLEKDKLGKAKGIVIGGIVFGFISILVLIFKRIIKMIL